MARTKRDVVEYRIYDLPVDLPVFTLSGEQWRISDAPSSRLHFHNCLEIGFCRSDSGYIRFEDEIVPFRAGDVFLIPDMSQTNGSWRSLSFAKKMAIS